MALNPYCGLAAAPRPQRRAEADHVLPDADAELLRRPQVAELVEGDRHGEPHDQEHDTDDERDHFHTATVPASGFELAVTVAVVACVPTAGG